MPGLLPLLFFASLQVYDIITSREVKYRQRCQRGDELALARYTPAHPPFALKSSWGFAASPHIIRLTRLTPPPDPDPDPDPLAVGHRITTHPHGTALLGSLGSLGLTLLPRRCCQAGAQADARQATEHSAGGAPALPHWRCERRQRAGREIRRGTHVRCGAV
jgi:hypothetical protein